MWQVLHECVSILGHVCSKQVFVVVYFRAFCILLNQINSHTLLVTFYPCVHPKHHNSRIAYNPFQLLHYPCPTQSVDWCCLVSTIPTNLASAQNIIICHNYSYLVINRSHWKRLQFDNSRPLHLRICKEFWYEKIFFCNYSINCACWRIKQR